MTFIIGKTFRFDAAHHLPHLPKGHKCRNPHGHTYTVTLSIISRVGLMPEGWVHDYGELKAFKGYIDGSLDHKDLNQVISGPTTAERIAQHLFLIATDLCNTLWPGVAVYSVRVQETPDTYAEYRQEN
jgi:6-pyruvoyltetrahydropterin/6-carboxytetrahydropterin synthase